MAFVPPRMPNALLTPPVHQLEATVASSPALLGSLHVCDSAGREKRQTHGHRRSDLPIDGVLRKRALSQ
jgi:hypothetical protein